MDSAEVGLFTDPLMDLLHSADLNKQVDLSNRLLAHIEDISDAKIRQWCIDSLTILRDLERIELKLHGWEFTTLDYRLDVEKHAKTHADNDIKLQLSRRVLKISLELYDQLNLEANNIIVAIEHSRRLTPRQLISDAGTILTELVLRLTKLREQLHKDISVGYSRAKLVIIGCELEDMVANVQSNSHVPQLDATIVNNYKQFVNTLLTQLEQSVTSGDTMSTMESIAIVGDVEKMFESMKAGPTPEKSIEEPTPKPSEDYDYDSEVTLVSPSSVQCSKSHRRTTSSLRNDNDLAKTTISEQLPSLLSAFKEEPHEDLGYPQQSESSEISEGSENSEKTECNDETFPVEPKPIETSSSSSSSPSPEIPIPSLMSSLFGSPMLRAFYQPQVKEPIYVPKATVSSAKLITADTHTLEEEECNNVVQTVYKASKVQEDALVHERRMKHLQQVEQLRLPHLKPRTDYLVPPTVTTLKEGRVRESVRVIERPLLGGALAWPSPK